jgi:hypothetical protein
VGQHDDIRATIERAVVFLALVTFGPLFVFILLARLFDLVAPALPMLLTMTAIAAIAFAVHKYRTSPLTIRAQHEREILDRLGRAEAQQRALLSNIETPLRVELDARNLLPIAEPAIAAAQAIYAEEFLRLLPPMPPVPLQAERVYDIPYDRRTMKKGEEPPYRIRTDAKGRPTTEALEEFKDFLDRFVDSTADPAETVALFVSTTAAFLHTLLSRQPLPEHVPSPQITVPLIEFAPSTGALIEAAMSVLTNERVRHQQHFSSVRSAYDRNRRKASEEHFRERDLAAGRQLEPRAHPGDSRAVLDAYLGGTPIRDLFLLPVPFVIPEEKRFEGHFIVARPGAGKTNALECLIAADLQAVADGRASLVVMDSQGTASDTLLGRLSHLKLFAPGEFLADRLIYLEPDLDFPLALNIFDIGLPDLDRLSAGQREDIVASACEVVEFLFTGLLGGELSDNMTMLYKYLVPAMLAIPGADMNTFIELLDTEATRARPVPAGYERYHAHFGRLEPEIRSFLETDFLKDPELVKTKAAVRRRLRAAMADTTFRRMFLQPKNKLNLFEALQSGKVILVNTYPARNYVEPFGRLILALLMQATRQRLAIDRTERMPTFVYIDECQDYIANEERIARYIDKCRKQNVALVFATQRLSNIDNPKVRNALAGVAIKFAGSSDADDAELASLTLTDTDHIRHLRQGSFAAYVSGLTPRGIDLEFPLSPLQRAARMTRDEWEEMRADMRRRYAERYDGRVGKHEDASPASAERGGDARATAPPEPATSTDPPEEGDDYDPLQ